MPKSSKMGNRKSPIIPELPLFENRDHLRPKLAIISPHIPPNNTNKPII